jgi:hypothetical protein
MKTISIVPVEYIHQAWAKVGKFIEAAMEHAKGECTADQLKVMLTNNQHQLMLFMEDKEPVGAVEFHFSNFPNDRVFYINAIGGKTCQEHTDMMFDFARLHGATTVRGSARESVARLWRQKYGFESIYITVEKRL